MNISFKNKIRKQLATSLAQLLPKVPSDPQSFMLWKRILLNFTVSELDPNNFFLNIEHWNIIRQQTLRVFLFLFFSRIKGLNSHDYWLRKRFLKFKFEAINISRAWKVLKWTSIQIIGDVQI